MNTKYFRNCVADNIFRGAASPPLPIALYIGLSSTEPDADGQNVTEPGSGVGYARVQLSGLSAAQDGVVTNPSVINFAESTGNWGTMTHFVIFDAAEDGNLLMYGALSPSRVIDTETIMTIKQNALTLSVLNPA